MAEKKQAVNLSLILVLSNLLLAFLCWLLQVRHPIMSFLFAVFSGVLGSGLAALWIFIAEYRREKTKLLEDIFLDINGIREDLPYFRQYVDDVDVLRNFLDTQYYQDPQPANQVLQMNDFEKTLYSLCRFADGMLDLGYSRIDKAIQKVHSVDFWLLGARHRDTITQRLAHPLYDVILSAPAREDDYVFRCFREFRTEKHRTAGEVLDIALKLNHDFHCSYDCGKPEKDHDDLHGQLYESLWIFRDAYCPPHRSHKERKEARNAFLYGTPYDRIR